MKNLHLVDDPRFAGHTPGHSHHPERPARILAARQGIERTGWASRTLAPRLATHDELTKIHDPAYLERLLACKGSRGFSRFRHLFFLNNRSKSL